MLPSIRGNMLKDEGKPFHFPESISLERESAPWAMETAAVFVQRLKKIPEFAAFHINNDDTEAICLHVEYCPDEQADAYRLIIKETGIAIYSANEAGTAFALTTLYWLLREEGREICCQEIHDVPKYRHRGFHLDCSRHFFDAETVKEMIEQTSLRKMNRLHWHLSDDQGYRIESRRFPKLNSIGSWRTEPDTGRYGGYYTFDEIREIVSFAKARGMEIIPEIDVPGHVSAMVAAYPELSCSGSPREVAVVHGIHEQILCAGKAETMNFVKELLSEVCDLFPFDYFHIGGDEAPKAEWKKCPHCQAKMKRLGLKSEEELQANFTEELVSFLREKGKTAIAWNETLKSGTLSDDVLIQYWAEEGDDCGYCDAYFTQNRPCVYSFSSFLYLDFSPALTPLRKIYSLREKLNSGNLIPEKNILGWEAAIWTEKIFDPVRLEQLAFPRLLAVAERTWSGENDYESFLDKCRKDISFLTADHIHCLSLEEADPHGETQMQAIVEEWRPFIQGVKPYPQYFPLVSALVLSKLNSTFEGAELEDIKHRLFD